MTKPEFCRSQTCRHPGWTLRASARVRLVHARCTRALHARAHACVRAHTLALVPCHAVPRAHAGRALSRRVQRVWCARRVRCMQHARRARCTRRVLCILRGASSEYVARSACSACGGGAVRTVRVARYACACVGQRPPVHSVPEVVPLIACWPAANSHAWQQARMQATPTCRASTRNAFQPTATSCLPWRRPETKLFQLSLQKFDKV